MQKKSKLKTTRRGRTIRANFKGAPRCLDPSICEAIDQKLPYTLWEGKISAVVQANRLILVDIRGRGRGMKEIHDMVRSDVRAFVDYRDIYSDINEWLLKKRQFRSVRAKIAAQDRKRTRL
jgi:hypothetical protein